MEIYNEKGKEFTYKNGYKTFKKFALFFCFYYLI